MTETSQAFDRSRKDVYVIPGFMETSIQSLFSERDYRVVSSPDEANILVWTGGADINPELYGSPKHPMTSYSDRRDKAEVALYDRFRSSDYLKVGICRGHQLLGAMNGAKLFQHVNNHGRQHDAFYTDEDGRTSIHLVSSAHHQMIDLARSISPFEVWLVSNEASLRELSAPSESFMGYDDPESIFWPETNSLGFQGHPEFGPKPCTDLFFQIVDRARTRYITSGYKRKKSLSLGEQAGWVGTGTLDFDAIVADIPPVMPGWVTDEEMGQVAVGRDDEEETF